MYGTKFCRTLQHFNLNKPTPYWIPAPTAYNSRGHNCLLSKYSMWGCHNHTLSFLYIYIYIIYIIYIYIYIVSVHLYSAFQTEMQNWFSNVASQLFFCQATLHTVSFFIIEGEPSPPRSTPWGVYRPTILHKAVPLYHLAC